jgi:hypothetical protein
VPQSRKLALITSWKLTAISLSQRGVRVHGIELSPAMAAHLRAKPGADGIGVTIGTSPPTG